MVLPDRIELSTSPFIPLPLSRSVSVCGLDHPFTVTSRSLGATRLASTPSRLRRAWLGIGMGRLGPLAFPDFGRFAPNRFRSGRQVIYQGSALPLSYGSKFPSYVRRAAL